MTWQGSTAALGLILALSGCGAVSGLFGGGDPEVCTVAPGDAGDLVGTYLRRALGNPTFTALPVSGRLRGDGSARRLSFDDIGLRLGSPAADGSQSGRRRSTATPLDALTAVTADARAVTLNYSRKGVSYQGALAYGALPAVSTIPGTGRAVFEGRVQMTLTGGPAGSGVSDERSVTGTMSIVVGYASRRADLRIDGISGGAGFSSIVWQNLSLCGARLASAGQGRARILDSGGTQLDLVGASDAGPAGSATFDSSLMAADVSGNGGPIALAGAFLLQGDSGAIGGVFTAGRQ